jgi:hypothetical protein
MLRGTICTDGTGSAGRRIEKLVAEGHILLLEETLMNLFVPSVPLNIAEKVTPSLFVNQVQFDSAAAEKAGIRRGDVIVSFDELGVHPLPKVENISAFYIEFSPMYNCVNNLTWSNFVGSWKIFVFLLVGNS